jgi:stage III sporulation protein AH
MFHQKRIVLLCVFSFIVIALYLQMTFKGENFSKEEFANTETAKDVISKSGATFVDNGTFTGNDFFSQAKLDREIAKGQSKETAKEILGNASIDPEKKDEAVGRITKLSEISLKENKIETLVKEKGFNDVFVAIAEDGSVDIIVKAPSLTGAEVAQLADIASRQADIPMNMIHIKNKY